MTDWMGLDSGGTEQLWDPEVLYDILAVMKKHEPFSRGDPESPIFDDLEQIHPQITWKNPRADGSFNPIFRRANPIVKLGLSTPETENALVTELGVEVLSGNLEIRDVFALAARAHTEQDGTKSMAKMCTAALRLPEQEFTAPDIEFGISERDDVETCDLEAVIADVRSKNLKLTGDTRPRRIRSFMNALVHSGAFAETELGWILHDATQAKKIAQATDEQLVKLAPTNKGTPPKVRRKVEFKRVETKDRTVGAFDLSKVGRADPIRTAIALERSNQLHEDIVAQLGLELEDCGHEPVENSDSFDLAVLLGIPAIFEVKTVNAKNAISQIRKAIIQLEEYRWRHLDLFQEPPRLFVALSENPAELIDDDYFDFIENDRGISVIWPEPHFVDQYGRNLQTILVPQS